ncbi:MAG: hypothetical protein Q9160_008763 [Pyrenula sp. 1 TL-2023]
MVLELYTWGPAFGLPSIDPQCLATIAYLSQALPLRDEWVLIPISDPTVSPNNELPALKSGTTWVTGFASIVDYLKKYSANHWDLDVDLDAQRKADLIAYASFVESRVQALFDVSFYVSTENYVAVTRPSYAEILYWPQQWTLPSKIRAKATKRSAYLGLSSLDVDSTDTQSEAPEKPNPHSLPRSLVAKHKDTVTSLLRQSIHQSQFKLDALTSDYFEPLERLLNSKAFLLSERQPTSLDCLVIGYLSPVLWSKLPRAWMKSSLEQSFPTLAQYVLRLGTDAFGPSDSPSAILAGQHDNHNSSESRLPWQAPEPPRVSALIHSVLDSVCENTPGIHLLRGKQSSHNSVIEMDETAQRRERARRREFYSQAAAVGAGISAFVGYLFWEGIVKLPPRRVLGRDQKSFGPAGAMLGIYSGH